MHLPELSYFFQAASPRKHLFYFRILPQLLTEPCQTTLYSVMEFFVKIVLTAKIVKMVLAVVNYFCKRPPL